MLKIKLFVNYLLHNINWHNRYNDCTFKYIENDGNDLFQLFERNYYILYDLLEKQFRGINHLVLQGDLSNIVNTIEKINDNFTQIRNKSAIHKIFDSIELNSTLWDDKHPDLTLFNFDKNNLNLFESLDNLIAHHSRYSKMKLKFFINNLDKYNLNWSTISLQFIRLL